MTIIRSEHKEDVRAIRGINLAAFPSQAEADLVDTLRDRGKLVLSLVAEEDGELVGHIAFSRVVIRDHPELSGLGLGPMAVIPARQGQGIGSRLVTSGIENSRKSGFVFVVVLGHRHYYPRFGFRSAKTYGISCRWEVPDDVFMALELQEGALNGIQGLANYEPEFNEV